MQEDTESFNENSSSEVIILPQNNHIDETLISDDDETDTESPVSYEAKLNAKLKDLGLYEDGMTIQQKEELLTVVAVSFKTAEEEKTRRQWYEEYANAALNFPEDEIEFSFQETPESSELSEKVPTISSEYHANAFKARGNSSLELERKTGLNASATVTRESLAQNDCHNLPSTSQTSSYKSKPQTRRNRSRGEGGSYKLSLNEGNTVTTHSAVILAQKDAAVTNIRQKKKRLEKCMSHWRPCLSPQDEPLLRTYYPETEELKVDSCSKPEILFQKRMQHTIQEFNFALSEIKKARKPPSHFGKPYHLTRSGHCLRKATKVDSLDIMVGVQEDKNEVASTSDSSAFTHLPIKKEPFSRTSGGAFRYAQFHRDRIDALRNNSSLVHSHNRNHTITRCSVPNSIDEYRTSPDILIEDEVLPDRFDSSALPRIDASKQSRCGGDLKISPDTKLPKFSNLRPDLCRDDFSEKHTLSRHLTLPYTSTSSTASAAEGCARSSLSASKKENQIESASQDGNLSDSSSVIDVETIVDDEIEEFVTKRKLFQESDKQQTYSNKQKRLKKNCL